MNRLSMYWQNAKLAKMYYAQAEEDARKGKIQAATLHLAQGATYLIAAMNNVASIAFHQKPKSRTGQGKKS